MRGPRNSSPFLQGKRAAADVDVQGDVNVWCKYAFPMKRKLHDTRRLVHQTTTGLRCRRKDSNLFTPRFQVVPRSGWNTGISPKIHKRALNPVAFPVESLRSKRCPCICITLERYGTLHGREELQIFFLLYLWHRLTHTPTDRHS